MSDQPMTPHVFIEAAGLDPGAFAVRAWAPPIEEKPGLVSGLVNGDTYVFIRAWPILEGPQGTAVREWTALAFVSKHPALVVSEIEPEEQERMRAESLKPNGADAPVGQEAVMGSSGPVYAPPLQQLDTAESVQGDNVIDSTAEELSGGVVVVPLGCGKNCTRATGPQGTVENHAAGCTLGQA